MIINDNMEIEFEGPNISLDKELNSIDKFVIDFVKHLNRIQYVIISGYVALVFGRSRSTEDIDMFIKMIPFDEFNQLWLTLMDEYDCLNTDDVKDAYEMLIKGMALRFAYNGKIIPNMEIKFPKFEIDNFALNNCLSLKLNNHPISVSSLELQIAYKLFLGLASLTPDEAVSFNINKDIEDARFLYKLFKEKLEFEKIEIYLRKLGIDIKKAKGHLGYEY